MRKETRHYSMGGQSGKLDADARKSPNTAFTFAGPFDSSDSRHIALPEMDPKALYECICAVTQEHAKSKSVSAADGKVSGVDRKSAAQRVTEACGDSLSIGQETVALVFAAASGDSKTHIPLATLSRELERYAVVKQAVYRIIAEAADNGERSITANQLYRQIEEDPMVRAIGLGRAKHGLHDYGQYWRAAHAPLQSAGFKWDLVVGLHWA